MSNLRRIRVGYRLAIASSGLGVLASGSSASRKAVTCSGWYLSSTYRKSPGSSEATRLPFSSLPPLLSEEPEEFSPPSGAMVPICCIMSIPPIPPSSPPASPATILPPLSMDSLARSTPLGPNRSPFLARSMPIISVTLAL